MYVLFLIMLYRRRLSLSSYSIFGCYTLFGVFFFSNEAFSWAFGYFSSFELRLNQLFQYAFKLECNWLFILLICVYFVYTYNNIVSFSILWGLIFLFFGWREVYSQNYLIAIDIFKVNEKLLNGWFMIHPFLTYYFYGVILTIFVLCYVYFFIYSKEDVYFIFGRVYLYTYILKNLMCRYVYVGLVALILGGWWAQQELSWNGWWGWDFVEIANLSIFVSYLELCHLNFLCVSAIFFRTRLNFLIFVLGAYAVSLRYNIFTSLHTFVGLGITLQFYLYVYLLLLFGILLFSVWNLKYYNIFVKFAIGCCQIIQGNLPYSLLSFVNVSICAVVFFSFFFYDYFFYLRDIFLISFFGYVTSICQIDTYCFVWLLNFGNVSFFALVVFISFFSLFLNIEYRFTKVLHIFVFFYFGIFIVYISEVDYFLWDHDLMSAYLFNIKQVLSYNFFELYSNANEGYSNYVDNSVFFNEYVISFFSENKLLLKNSLYTTHNTYVVNNIFFEFFEFKLFFSFINKMYNVLILFLGFFFYYLKRKISLIAVY